MNFSFEQFYQTNRRTLIWVIFFALLWLLRDFFGLIFLTFVIAFLTTTLVGYLQRRMRMPRRIAIILVYLLFLGGLVAGVMVLLAARRLLRPGIPASRALALVPWSVPMLLALGVNPGSIQRFWLGDRDTGSKR